MQLIMAEAEWVIWGAISVILVALGYLLNRRIFKKRTKKKSK